MMLFSVPKIILSCQKKTTKNYCEFRRIGLFLEETKNFELTLKSQFFVKEATWERNIKRSTIILKIEDQEIMLFHEILSEEAQIILNDLKKFIEESKQPFFRVEKYQFFTFRLWVMVTIFGILFATLGCKYSDKIPLYFPLRER